MSKEKKAPAPSSLAGEALERAARLIDPKAWEFADKFSTGPHAEMMRAEVKCETAASLRIAGEVLSALSPEAPARGEAAIWAKVEEAARRYARCYPEASDGRNTFVMFAEWAASEALTPRHEAPASDGEREPLCMAYKTGYAEGVEDSNGMFDRESCEEGWGQYAEKLSAQPALPARLPLPTVDDGRGGRRPINPQDDR